MTRDVAMIDAERIHDFKPGDNQLLKITLKNTEGKVQGDYSVPYYILRKASKFLSDKLDSQDESELVDVRSICVQKDTFEKFLAWLYSSRLPCSTEEVEAHIDLENHLLDEIDDDESLEQTIIVSIAEVTFLAAKWKIPKLFNHCLPLLELTRPEWQFRENELTEMANRCFQEMADETPFHDYLVQALVIKTCRCRGNALHDDITRFIRSTEDDSYLQKRKSAAYLHAIQSVFANERDSLGSPTMSPMEEFIMDDD